MSEVFDNIANTVKAVGSAAGKVAGEVVEVSRTKIQELKLKNELSETLERLGTITYDSKKNGFENPELTEMIISEIDGIKEKLSEIKITIKSEETEKYCPKCGFSNAAGSVFCCKCGAELDEKAE